MNPPIFKQSRALARLVNGLWNSNIAGGAASLGLGLGEHELIKQYAPGGNDMTPVGNVTSTALGSVLPALLLTPMGRQLMMKGRRGSAANYARAVKPLIGAGRVGAADWNPSALFSVATPKALATLGVPALDNMFRAVSSIPSVGKSLEQAASNVNKIVKGLNTRVMGKKPYVDPVTGQVYPLEDKDKGVMDYLTDSAKSLSESAQNTEAASKATGGVMKATNRLAGGMTNALQYAPSALGGAAGAGAGYLLGGLAGDAVGNTTDPVKAQRSKRLKAVLQLLGLAGGAYAGYRGGQELSNNMLAEDKSE